MYGTRTGVVLAAGFGSRLAGVSDDTRLKPLTPVGGRPLMLRTLDSLAVAACSRVVVVVGYEGTVVEQSVRSMYDGPLELEFVTNERFELSNGVSVLAARPYVSDTFVLTMADHVFGDEVMLLAAGHAPPALGATLLVDSKLDEIFDMDDAMKVVTRERSVVRIGKELTEFDSIDTGLFVCSAGLMDQLEAELESRGDASLSDGVSRLARLGRMGTLDIGDGFWQDVDTPEMLEHADVMLSQRTC